MVVLAAAGVAPVAHADAVRWTDDATPALPSVVFVSAGVEVAALSVEIAETAEETACGLMHRVSLPEDQGMLFIYAGRIGFWNRNTLIPLSVAYLSDDGRIVDILPMEATAYPGAPGIAQPDPREPYAYVIEANAGWFERHGVAIGDHARLDESLTRRWESRPPPLCLERGY